MLSPAAKANAQPTESFQQALSDASVKPDKVAKAAKDFEALMVGQVMKAARESSDGSWLGTGDDQAGSLAMDMAEQQFAQALASSGGLGIAKMVLKSLSREAKTASNDPNSASPAPLNTDSKL